MRSFLYTVVGFAVFICLGLASEAWVRAAPEAATPTNGLYFSDENNGWVVGNGGLIAHTSNSGQDWQVQNSGTSKDLYEVQFIDTNTGWAIGAAGTILHTTNGGASWQPQTSPAAVDLHGLFLLNSQTGWIGFPDGVLKTTNGGATWAKTGTGVTFQVRDIQFLDANKGFLIGSDLDINYELLTTSDGGATWNKSNFNFSRPMDLYFLNPTFGVVADRFGTIYITHDGGANWQEIPWSGSTIHLSVIHFVDADHGWVVSHEGAWPRDMLRTTDGGQHWSKLNGGGNDVQFISVNKGFIADADGIRRSLDGGYNWSTVYPAPSATPTPTSVSGPLKQTNGLDFLDENNGWGVGNGGLIIHTSNSGQDWQVQNSGTTKDLYEVQFVDANNGWVIGAGGTILHTTNGGGAWQAQGSLPAVVDLHGIFFLNNQAGWIGFPDGVLKTIDGGNHWTKTGVGVTFQVRSIQFLDANKGFLIGSDLDINYELLTTVDGGETWTKVNINWDRYMDLYFLNSTFGVIVERFGSFYVTHDGGANWQRIETSISGVELNAAHFIDANNGWAVGKSVFSKNALVHTTDGGQHWSLLTDNGNDIQFVSTTKGFIASDDGVKLTTDGGYNWSSIYPSQQTPPPTTPPPTITPSTVTPVPTDCYLLTRLHNGDGTDPQVTPDHSDNCPNSRYNAGATISLKANPGFGWQVAGWSGTDQDASKSLSNHLTMPASDRAVAVTYIQAPVRYAPLRLGCDGVTPPGDEQPATCLSGLVYFNGKPVAGADVQIETAQGAKMTVLTTTHLGAELRPYYALSLGGPPLSVFAGQTIAVKAQYDGVVRTIAYVVQPGSQQVDIVLSQTLMSATPPIATVMSASALELNQGDPLTVRGIGQDSDETATIIAYRWVSDKNGELGTGDTLALSTASLITGTHHLSFEVQNNKGEWSAPVVIELFIAPPAQAAWTALLYLAGDFHDGGQLLNRFEFVLSRLGQLPANPNVRIAIQLDGPLNGDTRRMLISPGGAPTTESQSFTEAAMDDPQALADFVRWGQHAFPAQHYYVAIADHGQAVQGIAWDTTSDVKDGKQDDSAFLTVEKLAEALRGPDIAPIDVLHLDACSMNLVESGFALRNVANILVASQYLGWNYFSYDEYLKDINANTTAEEFARTVVSRYAQTAKGDGHPYTIAALNLVRVDPTLTAINELAQNLVNLLDTKQISSSVIDEIWQQSGKFESNGDYVNSDSDDYIDLLDWVTKLKAQVTAQSVQDAANSLINELSSSQFFILASDASSGPLLPRYANGVYINLTYAHGLSIFYPPCYNNAAFDNYINDRLFSFTQYSTWKKFLLADCATTAPPPPKPAPGPLPSLDTTAYIYLPMIRR